MPILEQGSRVVFKLMMVIMLMLLLMMLIVVVVRFDVVLMILIILIGKSFKITRMIKTSFMSPVPRSRSNS